MELVAASSNIPVFINQIMLKDLVEDQGLPKQKAEVLGSRLKQWNSLEEGTKISEFRHRKEKLNSLFDSYHGLSFCNDVNGLIMKFGYEHKSDDCRLYIYLSKTSLKAVLLHNGNT